MRVSLSLKFLFLMISAVVLFSFSFAWISLQRFRLELERQTVERGKALASNLAGNSVYFAVIEDEPRLQNLVDNLVMGDVLFAEIVRGDRVLAIRTLKGIVKPLPHPMTSPPPTPRISRQVLQQKPYYDLVYPLVWGESSTTTGEELLFPGTPRQQKEQIIGYARIGISLAGVQSEMRRELIVILWITALYLFLGVLLAYLVYKTLVQPVGVLTRAVQAFSRGEVHTVQIRTGDELQVLSEEFNRMTASILQTRMAVEETNRQLREALRVKSEFLANISHELKTPLSAIIGFSQLLLEGVEGKLDEKQREDVSVILSSARHLLGLISQILDFSKIEAGKEELKREKFQPAEVLTECYRSTLPLAEEKGLRLVLSLPPSLPLLNADRMKLRQVILNLLSNAFKFTPEGTVELGARASDREMIFWVKDTGIGILPEHRKRIFEPFFQVESGETRRYAGAGLGLAIVKSYVLMHGGDVWVESPAPAGSGSTFLIRLPL